jgi:hypothetical protein
MTINEIIAVRFMMAPLPRIDINYYLIILIY